MNDGEEQFRRIYAYVRDTGQQALDASRSPFLADIQDECKWFAEYYENGMNFLYELWFENFAGPSGLWRK